MHAQYFRTSIPETFSSPRQIEANIVGLNLNILLTIRRTVRLLPSLPMRKRMGRESKRGILGFIVPMRPVGQASCLPWAKGKNRYLEVFATLLIVL